MAKDVEPGSAVHLALEELDLVVDALGAAAVPSRSVDVLSTLGVLIDCVTFRKPRIPRQTGTPVRYTPRSTPAR